MPLNNNAYHFAHKPHCTATVIYILTNVTANISLKKYAIIIKHANAILVPETNMPLKFHICYMLKLPNVHQWESMPIYMSYELTSINHVTRNALHRWQWQQYSLISFAQFAMGQICQKVVHSQKELLLILSNQWCEMESWILKNAFSWLVMVADCEGVKIPLPPPS